MSIQNQRCDRCAASTRSTIMSMFNTDTLCQGCKERERQHPAYAIAAEAERSAVLGGIRNFAGIGKPEDL